MGFFKSRAEENEEAYQRGIEAGKEADWLSDAANLMEDLCPATERAQELSDIERAGYEYAKENLRDTDDDDDNDVEDSSTTD